MEVIERPDLANNASRGKYRAMANILDIFAASRFDLRLSQDTLRTWRCAFDLIQKTDDLLDNGDDQGQIGAMSYLESVFMSGESKGLQQYQPQPTDDALNILATTLRKQITDKQAQRFFAKGVQAIRVNKLLKETTDIKEFATLTRLEGQLTASMLVQLISQEDRVKPNANNFVRFVRRSARSGNLFDSIADLGKDFNNNQAAISPTFINKVRLTAEIIPDVRCVIRDIGFMALLKTSRHCVRWVHRYPPKPLTETNPLPKQEEILAKDPLIVQGG